MSKKPLALGKVYRLIEPGPVILLTTSFKGKPNVMPQSWHLMMEFEPPLIGFIVSDRNYSFEALVKTGECAINVPSSRLLEKVVKCGNVSGQNIDKFKKFGLTPLPASSVEAPLILECFANLECRVVDRTLSKKYGFFVVEVVKAWMDRTIPHAKTLHHQGRGLFMIAGRTVKTRSRAK